MKIKKLCIRAKTVKFLGNLIALLIVTAACAGAIVGLWNIARLATLIVTGSIWFVSAILLLIWPFLWYNKYSYGYDEKRIYIEFGVIFRHRITIPVCQIQDIHYFEGPIMMMFKLGKTIFSTAGSNFALGGLDREDAKRMVNEIEEYLRRRIEENGDEKI